MSRAIAFRGVTPFLQTNPTNCILDNGHVHFAFGTDPQNWYPAPGLSGQLWIDVDDVMALHERLVGKVPIEWGPEVYSYGRLEFAIKDCNGYLLTFSAPAAR